MKTLVTIVVSTLMLVASVSCFCAPDQQLPQSGGDHHGHHTMDAMGGEHGESAPCHRADCDTACGMDQRFVADRDRDAKQRTPVPDDTGSHDNPDFINTGTILLAVSANRHETDPPYFPVYRSGSTPVNRHDLSLQ